MIFNLGSINADHFYQVPQFPNPGETIAATDFSSGLGGKGANQSVAAAQAGASVTHIGAIGANGAWTTKALGAFGIDTRSIETVDVSTGHAVINIDDCGENTVVLLPGANQRQSLTKLKTALSSAKQGDILLLQNETNLQVEAARMAREKRMFVIYSAAPFSPSSVEAVSLFVDLLVMNEIESKQLTSSLGVPLDELPIAKVLVTRGISGADWIEDSSVQHCPAFVVNPIDTTGAGDCFAGYVAAGLDQGLNPLGAMRLGAAASALHVQKKGTADAIPSRAEVDAFLGEQA